MVFRGLTQRPLQGRYSHPHINYMSCARLGVQRGCRSQRHETSGSVRDSWPEDPRNCCPLTLLPVLHARPASQEPTPQPHIQLSFPRALAPCSCCGHIAFLRGMCPTVVWGSVFSVVGVMGRVESMASSHLMGRMVSGELLFLSVSVFPFVKWG